MESLGTNTTPTTGGETATPAHKMFEIFVKDQSGKAKIFIVGPNTTVYRLKQQIEQESEDKLLIALQQLVYNSSGLIDGQTMGELKIKKDSVIILVMRQPMDPELCEITYKIGPWIHSLKDQYDYM